MLTFDPEKHEYRLDGQRVPSVTQVIWDLLPGFEAGEWYLERGTAVHACAAMIAAGQDFEHDPVISGQVAACRRFFAEIKPQVLEIEHRVFSAEYQFAGTLDLWAMIAGHDVIIDWKSHVDERCGWQLAAYSLCLPGKIKTGYGVQLNDDGTYKMTPFKLATYAREFLAMRAAFGLRERMGINKRERAAE
jgi:hypothetical protein